MMSLSYQPLNINQTNTLINLCYSETFTTVVN
jgi:hypothetical protein